MKKIFFGIICLAMAAGFYSCNNSDPEFQVMNYLNYGVQTSNYEFRPIVAFSVSYGSMDNSTARIMHEGSSLPVSVTTKNVAEADKYYPSLDMMEGTYTFTCSSTDLEPASAQLKLAFDKALGEMEIENFIYENNTLKMTVVNPVENAIGYGFYIRPIVDGAPYTSWIYDNIIMTNDTPVKSGEQVISNSFNFSNLSFTADEVVIYPAAFNKTAATNTLIRLGEGRTLRKDATSFTE